MAFDFPAAPFLGAVYDDGKYSYTWDGEKWMRGSVLGGGVAGDFVLKSGDTMLGFLTANADPTMPLHYATKQYVDLIFGTLGGPGEAHVINQANQPEWGAPIDSGNF